MKKFAKLVGFDPVAKQTSVKTEIVAGIVTFLAMAYILTVNPAQILVGADQAYWPSVFIATALGAIIGTLLMAFLAKMPLAQASGMGLNSLLGGLVAIWAAGTYGVRFSLGQAFMMVLISGVIFLALTLNSADNLMSFFPFFHKARNHFYRVLEITAHTNRTVTGRLTHRIKR